MLMEDNWSTVLQYKEWEKAYKVLLEMYNECNGWLA
jgi:hypothetical protein